MNNYQMNIHLQYLKNIASGLKRHEYRLANDKRRAIEIGDTITFIANEDANETLKVKVTGSNIYPNWEKAITSVKDVLNEFSGIYQNKEEIIENCKKFYSKQDVNKYGVIVYEIKLVN